MPPDHLTALVAAVLAGIAAIIAAAAPIVTHRANRKMGQSRDAAHRSEYVTLSRTIERNHEMLMVRLDTVERKADATQGDATAALHVAIGIDGKNGVRGDLSAVDRRVEGLEDRERIRERDARVHGEYHP